MKWGVSMSLDDQIRDARVWADLCDSRRRDALQQYDRMKREDYELGERAKRHYEEAAEECRMANVSLGQLMMRKSKC